MQQVPTPTIGATYRSASINGAGKTALVAPLYLCLIAGTGGIYTPANIQSCFTAPRNPIIEIRGHHTKRNQIISLSEQLINLREMFGLTMTEIAQIFGVTRPTVYAWLNGAEPRPDLKSKLWSLARISEGFRNAGLKTIGSIARHPIANGRSIIDLLKSGDDVQFAADSIRYAAIREMQTGKRRREFGPPSRTRRNRIDEVSTVIVTQMGEES